jgi:hypothetical protein
MVRIEFVLMCLDPPLLGLHKLHQKLWTPHLRGLLVPIEHISACPDSLRSKLVTPLERPRVPLLAFH